MDIIDLNTHTHKHRHILTKSRLIMQVAATANSDLFMTRITDRWQHFTVLALFQPAPCSSQSSTLRRRSVYRSVAKRPLTCDHAFTHYSVSNLRCQFILQRQVH